jgi:hypothetical protein
MGSGSLPQGQSALDVVNEEQARLLSPDISDEELGDHAADYGRRDSWLSRFTDAVKIRMRFRLIVVLLVMLFIIFLFLALSSVKGLNHVEDVSVVYQHGAVAAEIEICSEAGVNILKAGGNALDAAIAAALCTGCVNLFASGIGG